MKSITLCLLVVVSASCLVSANANASDLKSADFESFDELDALFDSQDDYMEIGETSFMHSVVFGIHKVMSTTRGVNCMVKDFTDILLASTTYVDAIDACGVAVPKDILAIVNNVKSIIALCNKIITLKSCSKNDSTSNKRTPLGCFLGMSGDSLRIARLINKTIKMSTNFPKNTSACFVDATNTVVANYKSFLPAIEECIKNM